MSQGFFDHVFFWIFVVASLLTAVDWWIGPEGRGAMRERMGLWWLHVSEMSFAGLVAEDAVRVQGWLRGIFGQRWLGLRALLVCSVISLFASLAIWIGSILAVYAQAEIREGPVNLPQLAAKMYLGYEVRPEEVILGPEDAGIPSDIEADVKRQILQDIRSLVSQLRQEFRQGFANVLLPLFLLNALLDWVSLGVTLLLLGWMARSITAWRLAGLIVLDLTLAILLAVTVGLLVAIYAYGPEEFAQTWISNFAESSRVTILVMERTQQLYAQLGIWDGMIVLPVAILFTSALPTLVHSVVAMAFLCSKLFRPVLQPVVSRALYLFHASRQGVLTQLAVGGGILTKAGQETIKYLAS